MLKLRPGNTGPATLKYRLEDEMISEFVASRQAAGDTRPMQEIAVEYNDTVIYPDKVRLNCYYYRHYSFAKDIQIGKEEFYREGIRKDSIHKRMGGRGGVYFRPCMILGLGTS